MCAGKTQITDDVPPWDAGQHLRWDDHESPTLRLNSALDGRHTTDEYSSLSQNLPSNAPPQGRLRQLLRLAPDDSRGMHRTAAFGLRLGCRCGGGGGSLQFLTDAVEGGVMLASFGFGADGAFGALD